MSWYLRTICAVWAPVVLYYDTRSCFSELVPRLHISSSNTMTHRPLTSNVPQECLHSSLLHSCGCNGGGKSAQATLKTHAKLTFRIGRIAVGPAHHMGESRQNHAARHHTRVPWRWLCALLFHKDQRTRWHS